LAEDGLLLLGQWLLLGALHVVVGMAIEPLWIVERALSEKNNTLMRRLSVLLGCSFKINANLP